MTSSTPAWIQILQALSTPMIAVLALVIGYAQWRTAQQRAVVELFDKRMKFFDEVREVIGSIMGPGSVSNDTFNAYIRAIDRSDILFRPEVGAYLDDLKRALAMHQLAEEQMAHPRSEKERLKAIEIKSHAFEKITAFYTDFPKLINRYVQMHQRMPRF
jgi:hypothetical protein